LYRLAVLTDPDTADGFRLAGVDVYEAETTDIARKTLAQLVDDDTTGIIAVNTEMMEAIDERLQRKIDSIYRPIVISLPITEKLRLGEERGAYLSRLIRRAIGFDITLRRG
jgi:V/A-type H+/Na+-transporting ATPase subunit F